MTYKKYIMRNGKLYGPYEYHSKRENGKVISEYYGKQKKQFNYNYLWLIFGVFLIIGLSFFVYNFQKNNFMTGKTILNIEASYIENKTLDGKIRIDLNQGEFIPASSKLSIETSSGKSYEYALKDLISENLTTGDFYIEGTQISGNGEGYGMYGIKKSYPNIYFILEVFKTENEKFTEETTPEKEIESEINSTTLDSNESKNTSIHNVTNNSDNFSNTTNNDNQIKLNTSETKQEETKPSENNKNPSTSETKQEETKPSENNKNPSTSETKQEETKPSENNKNPSTSETKQEETKPSENNKNPSTSETKQEETKPSENNKNPSTSETKQEETKPSENNKNPSTSETKQEETKQEQSTLITGGVIGSKNNFWNFFKFFKITGNSISETKKIKEIEGIVSKDKPFVYELSEGETAKIKSGSVRTENRNLSNENISIKINKNQLVVESNYFESETGFGKDYVGNEKKEIVVNLNLLNISSEKENLNVKLFYEDIKILSLTTNLSGDLINVTQEIKNQSINLTLNNSLNQSLNESLNQSLLNVTPTSLFELTQEEKQILKEYFGNTSINTTKSELFNGRLIVQYNINNYWVEYSYEYNNNSKLLKSKLDKDRIKWLKDLTTTISNSKNITKKQNMEEFIDNYTI